VIKGWDLGVATMKKGELAKFTLRSDYAYGESGSPPKIPGGATLVFEIELLDWRSVKDIAGDGGVIKTVLKEGEGWATPKLADEVCVEITASVKGADKPFFSTPDGGVEFPLTQGHLCEAVKTAVKTMKKGEHAKLIVTPECELFVLSIEWIIFRSYVFYTNVGNRQNYVHIKIIIIISARFFFYFADGFGAAGLAPDVPANAALEIGLTLLSWKKVDSVTADGAVVKKTLVETEEWQRPNAGASVTVAYIGRLTDGTIFDEHPASDPFTFTTDEEMAPCEGFELAVMQMKRGEKALVSISPSYGFGAQGSPQPKAAVPGDARLEYEIELVSFIKAKESWDMDTDEKLSAASDAKDKGNASFKAGKLERAVKQWERAKQCIENDDSFEPDKKRLAKELKRSCDLNLAAAHLKAKRPIDSRKAAEKVLQTDPFHLKALYRRAQSYIDTGDWVEAAQDIKKAIGVEPDNVDFKMLARKLKSAETAASKGEAALWANTFKKMAGLLQPA